MMSLLDVKMFDDMSVRLDTMPALDRRTDKQNCENNIALRVHCEMLTHDKN